MKSKIFQEEFRIVDFWNPEIFRSIYQVKSTFHVEKAFPGTPYRNMEHVTTSTETAACVQVSGKADTRNRKEM